MTVALVAGSGALPRHLSRTFDQSGIDHVICALHETALAWCGRPVIRFRLETLGSLIADLQQRGVDRVCFAGGIARPVFDPAKLDPATAPLVPRMVAALGQGDDAALKIVLEIFGDACLTPIGAHEVLPELLPPSGVLAGPALDDRIKADAARAARVLSAMSVADLGQGCVVAGAQVLAVETALGTDWMLGSLIAARASHAPTLMDRLDDPLDWAMGAITSLFTDDTPDPTPLSAITPPGGVLMKAPKEGQDRRIDLPTIGPVTVRLAAEAGLDAIVAEAGGVLVIDRPGVIDLANALGLTIWVREAGA